MKSTIYSWLFLFKPYLFIFFQIHIFSCLKKTPRMTKLLFKKRTILTRLRLRTGTGHESSVVLRPRHVIRKVEASGSFEIQTKLGLWDSLQHTFSKTPISSYPGVDYGCQLGGKEAQISKGNCTVLRTGHIPYPNCPRSQSQFMFTCLRNTYQVSMLGQASILGPGTNSY